MTTEQGDVRALQQWMSVWAPREHRATLDRLTAALERAEHERDNLDDNLSRVQRHLQHAVRKLSRGERG